MLNTDTLWITSNNYQNCYKPNGVILCKSSISHYNMPSLTKMSNQKPLSTKVICFTYFMKSMDISYSGNEHFMSPNKMQHTTYIQHHLSG